MHEALSSAATALDLHLPHLRTAADLTDRKFNAAQQAARSYLHDAGLGGVHHLDIVVFGSIARDEMTEDSDFDWLVVARRPSEDPDHFVQLRLAAVEALQKATAKDPGSSGLFGAVVGAAGLVNTIGLDKDTNLNQTRRILILEESRSLLEPDRHRELRSAITARYLHDQQQQLGKVPRFLLNDVVRYWRTVAVDYQAKRWKELDNEKWGLRLLKLRSSRKLTFAGTLASLFLPVLRGEEATVDGLLAQWEMPPLARLAQLHTVLGEEASTALAQVLSLADRFSGWLASHEVRTEARRVDHLRDAEDGAPLSEAYAATHELNRALLDLFFCEEPVAGSAVEGGLRELSHRYLVF